MQKISLLSISSALLLFAAGSAFATVNHGDFIGTGVDFLQVKETTTTGGDPEPIWEAPTLSGSGDSLLFFPSAFTSSCAGGTSDQTSSTLDVTIMAQAGQSIDTISLVEAGDGSLSSFPPFGTSATNASAALSGSVTVTEDLSGPIAPVVIPFSGTFLPMGTFELPTNFGAFTWTGSMFVDVASMVPGAQKVELSLDNDLDSNCAAGATSAVIQKKSVGGPSVALIVNPVECDLELEKTCCVTQPALPELDRCEGEVVRTVFKYTGESCKGSNNHQGGKHKCSGKRRIGDSAEITILADDDIVQATPNTNLHYGDHVEFTCSAGNLPKHLKFKTRGSWWRKQHMSIDTSCDRALRCGDRFGAYEVVEYESTLGGVVDCDAEPPTPTPVCSTGGDPVGTPCDAKVVDMVLEYNGQACQMPLPNPQNGEAECSGDATGAVNVGVTYAGKFAYKETISPASNINDGDRIRVTSTHQSGMFPNQKYLLSDDSGVLQSIEFHTSCSQPLALGDEFGSFKLVEFTTKNGTTVALGGGGNGTADLCEVPLAPKGPHCTSDLQGLTLVYIGDLLGEGCTVSNSQGGYGTCSGVADPGDPVSVAISNPGLVVDPDDQIEFGDLIQVTADDDGDIGSFVNVDVTGAGGSQWIQIKTSCYKPLSLGDRFGSLVVFGMDREDEGPISLGGKIQYQYKVTNPNADTVDNVEVTDSELGVIVSGESLAPGEMKTFTKEASVFGSVINTGTVMGDVDGAMCSPAMDTAEVVVDIPPYGSFTCSEPINELTMIWNGAQTVDVKAWDGAVGSSTLIGTYNDVAPGDSITVDSLGAAYPIWEIFDSTGTVKLGESSFDLWCHDYKMNGIEDCGKAEGNRETNDPGLINDWLLEGMVDTDETLECTPGLPPGVPPSCGFGPELLFLMPGLFWLHRRRMRKTA